MRALALSLPLLGAVVASCGPGVAPRAATGPSGTFGVVPGGARPGAWFGDDAGRTRAAGAGEAEVLTVDVAAAGDRVTVLMEAPAADCVLFLARATDGVDDLDLYAFGEDGQLLAADEGQDKTPALQVCPPHPRRIFVAARVVTGRGMVAIGAARVPTAQAVAVAAKFGARGAPGNDPPREGPWQELDRRLDEHRRRLGGRWQDVRRAVVPVDARAPTRVSAVVEAGRCLDALMLPADEVANSEMIAEDAQGKVLARARVTGRDRWMVLCATERTPVTFALRPLGGVGFVALVLSASPPGRARDLAEVAVPLGRGSAGTLDEGRRALDRALRDAGFRPARTAATGRLAVGTRATVPLDLAEGCTRLDVLGAAPLRALEGWLFAEDGALQARARGDGAFTLHSCGARRRVRLDLEATSLPGDFLVEAREEPGAPELLAREPIAAARLLGRALDMQLIVRAADLAVESGTVSDVRAFRQVAEVESGRCLEVIAALGEGAEGVELRILDGSDRELARGQGARTAWARFCPPGGRQQVRLEVLATAGAGPILVGRREATP